jgi:hypothetical protein
MLQANLEAQETAIQEQEIAIQAQENEIVTLQTQMQQSAPPIDPEAFAPQFPEGVIARDLKTRLGNAVWFCLHERTQRDLSLALERYQRIQAEAFTAQTTDYDYSEAGDRLGAAVHREVVQPFFRALQTYRTENEEADTDLLVLPQKKPSLEMLPPLLAERWQTFQGDRLCQNRPPDERDFYVITSNPAFNPDQQRQIILFLQTWEHPLAEWLLSNRGYAAATLDQIGQLRSLANRPEDLLYEWQFQRMAELVLGGSDEPGLFREIYGAK